MQGGAFFGALTVDSRVMDHLAQRHASGRWSPQLQHALAHAPDLATAATHVADCSIPVFPCVPGGKQPLTVHGFHDASTATDVVRSWWRRWPEANIGVPTGSVGGVDVVDVDVHGIRSGFGAFERARRAGFVEGWAWLVRTPSGGLHAYFLRTTVTDQKSWQVPSQHIDFRGDGGYVIVPPSSALTDDGVDHRYRLIAVAEHHWPTQVDALGLRGFLDPAKPLRPPPDVPSIRRVPDKLAAWVASRPEGARNGGLFWAACRMAEDGHDLSSTTSLLGQAAHAAGLPEAEALATIRSAFRIAARVAPAPPARLTRAVEAVGL
jgi:hypothetical protein